MKRLALLLGPVLALIGAAGLFMFGSALVGVFDVLTVRSANPPQSVPQALAELPRAVLSLVAVVIGLVIASVALVVRDGRRTISVTGRMMYLAAGVLLLVAVVPLAWSVMGIKGSFRVIATSPTTATAATAASLRDMIQSVEPAMTIGYGLLGISATLLLVAGLFGFQTSSSQAQERQAGVCVVFAMGAALLGMFLLALLLTVRSNGNTLEAMLTDAAVTPKPAELAAHSASILNKALIVFGGLGTLGLLQMLTSRLLPSSAGDDDVGILSEMK